MKKIIALVVAIVMMAAMAVPAFASDYEVGVDETLNAATVVTFGVDQTYTVTIPAAVTFEGLTGQVPVSVSDVKIPGGKSLYIAVTSTNGWELDDTTNDANENVAYTATVAGINNDEAFGDTPVEFLIVPANTQTVEGVVVGANGTATINLATNGTGKVGIYTDTLTFSAEIK